MTASTGPNPGSFSSAKPFEIDNVPMSVSAEQPEALRDDLKLLGPSGEAGMISIE